MNALHRSIAFGTVGLCLSSCAASSMTGSRSKAAPDHTVAVDAQYRDFLSDPYVARYLRAGRVDSSLSPADVSLVGVEPITPDSYPEVMGRVAGRLALVLQKDARRRLESLGQDATAGRQRTSAFLPETSPKKMTAAEHQANRLDEAQDRSALALERGILPMVLYFTDPDFRNASDAFAGPRTVSGPWMDWLLSPVDGHDYLRQAQLYTSDINGKTDRVEVVEHWLTQALACVAPTRLRHEAPLRARLRRVDERPINWLTFFAALAPYVPEAARTCGPLVHLPQTVLEMLDTFLIREIFRLEAEDDAPPEDWRNALTPWAARFAASRGS